MRALVVFHGHGGAWWNRWCRAGFRHCFIVLDDGACWIALDGTLGRARLKVMAASDFDLAGYYRAQGFTVVAAAARDGPPFWPLILATCVGAIKRILVIRAPWVLSPHQLFVFLQSTDFEPTRNTSPNPQGD
jgi:hypothetical protein